MTISDESEKCKQEAKKRKKEKWGKKKKMLERNKNVRILKSLEIVINVLYIQNTFRQDLDSFYLYTRHFLFFTRKNKNKRYLISVTRVQINFFMKNLLPFQIELK